jgi:hypothetical protein
MSPSALPKKRVIRGWVVVRIVMFAGLDAYVLGI